MATKADRIQEAANQFPDINPRAAMAASWIERRLTLSKNLKGEIGPKFILAPFQLELLDAIYTGEPGDPYLPRDITRVFVSMARANGKTELLAAISLLHLIGPESVRSALIINMAGGSKAQADITLMRAKEMVIRNPYLNNRIRFAYGKLIYENGSDIRVQQSVSTKTQGLQGLRPTLFSLDEHSESSNRDLYESLNLATSFPFSMGWLASTRSLDPSSIYVQLDTEIETGQTEGNDYDHWYRRVWSADITKDDLYTWEQTLSANPGVGYTIDEKSLRQALAEAKSFITARPNFRARKLNIETGEKASLIDPGKWMEAALPLTDRDALWDSMRNERARVSMDIGNTLSMSSLGVWWLDKRLFSCVSFMPRHMVQQMTTLHKAPYAEWADSGRLILVDTDEHLGYDYGTLADWLLKCFDMFDIVEGGLRYDGWHFKRVLMALSERGMWKEHPPLRNALKPFTMGLKTESPAIKEFEDLIYAGIFKHDNDPVTNMSIRHCLVESDPSATKEEKKIAKNKNALPNDPACALIMAVGTMEDDIVPAPVSAQDMKEMHEYIRGEIEIDEDERERLRKEYLIL